MNVVLGGDLITKLNSFSSPAAPPPPSPSPSPDEFAPFPLNLALTLRLHIVELKASLRPLMSEIWPNSTTSRPWSLVLLRKMSRTPSSVRSRIVWMSLRLFRYSYLGGIAGALLVDGDAIEEEEEAGLSGRCVRRGTC